MLRSIGKQSGESVESYHAAIHNYYKVIKAKKKTTKKLTHYDFPTIHTVIDRMHPNSFFDNICAGVNRINTIF